MSMSACFVRYGCSTLSNRLLGLSHTGIGIFLQ